VSEQRPSTLEPDLLPQHPLEFKVSDLIELRSKQLYKTFGFTHGQKHIMFYRWAESEDKGGVWVYEAY
jgi:hypothetical protein